MAELEGLARYRPKKSQRDGWLSDRRRGRYLLVYMAIKPAKVLVKPVCVLLLWPTMESIAANCLL